MLRAWDGTCLPETTPAGKFRLGPWASEWKSAKNGTPKNLSYSEKIPYWLYLVQKRPRLGGWIFGFCQLWSPNIPDHDHRKKNFFSNFDFWPKTHLLCFLLNKIRKIAINENGCLLQRTHVKFFPSSLLLKVPFKLQVGEHLGTWVHIWVRILMSMHVGNALRYEGGHFGARAHIQTCWL